MRYWVPILTICGLIFLSGCSNTRFLTGDQVLYTGRQKVKISNSQNIPHVSRVKTTIKTLSNHKVNNSMFGRRVLPPVGLWIHNYIKTDNKKKFGSWLYKTLSSSPILISDVNPALRAAKIENSLFDEGYFNTRAWVEIHSNKRNLHKAKVSYFVDLAPPHYYNKIVTGIPVDQIDTIINKSSFTDKIRPGDKFNLDLLKTSRITLSREIQDKGYFYFLPEFIDLKADTTVSYRKINLLISKNKDLPSSVLSAYTINSVFIYNRKETDSTLNRSDTIIYDGIRIISAGDILKPSILANCVSFRSGDTYSYHAYQTTMSRLNNLGIFKSVNISYMRNKSDSLSHLLDVRIDLIMSDNINLDFEANLATKSSGYLGPQFSAGISNNNARKGAEKLKAELTGGFEWQWGTKSSDQIGTYSYQIGLKTGLTLLGIVAPLIKREKTDRLLEMSSVNMDASLLNRTAYYKMLSARTNLNYQWSRNVNIKHSLYPLYINSVHLLATTARFDSVVSENIYIRKSFEEQFILGAKYEFNFNNTISIRPNNFLFQAGISTSGNLADLLTGIGKKQSDRPYRLFNNIYSQFFKITSDVRYYRNWSNRSLVMRLFAGIGLPFGNSAALPYVEQFFSGGAYSIRAFTARYLGPGSFHSDDHSGYIDQSGDVKLEGNLEYRFNITGLLKGALFVDAGNIWLVNEDLNRPGSEFRANTFLDQLAVGSGFGLRFDFTFFVLRADVGFPLRTPYMTNGKNWLFRSGKPLSDRMFNLAIGYPF